MHGGKSYWGWKEPPNSMLLAPESPETHKIRPPGSPRLKDTRSASSRFLSSFLSPLLGVKMDPGTQSFGKDSRESRGEGENQGESGGEGRPREQPDPLIRAAGVQIAFVWSGIKSGHTREGLGVLGRWRGPCSGTAEDPRTGSTPLA